MHRVTRALALSVVATVARAGCRRKPETQPAPEMTPTQFSETYGSDEVTLEVWLVDGELRRIVLVLERERALYGGTDRTEFIHAVGPAPGAELEVPPVGRIENR